MDLTTFTPFTIKASPKQLIGPISGLMILLFSLFASNASYGQCPAAVSTPSGCPTGVNIPLVYPTVTASCANPTDGGCATWTFSNLPYDGICPVRICFVANQGCGNANGNLCLYSSDGAGGCDFISSAGDGSEFCVDVTSSTYQITLCRPGSGPVSLNNISITTCCTPSVSCNTLSNVDIEGCAIDIPAAITDPATVFTYEACGATVTMTHSDIGDTDFCTDGDGVDFTRTYTLFFDGVAQTPTCSQTIQVDDTTDPQFANCPASPIDLGCNPTPPTAADAIAAAGTATDNCGGSPSVGAVGGSITNNGCNRTQVWTVTATDACENEGVCQVTYTWQVVTAPAFASCGNTIDLGCNPETLPTCDNYASLTGGAVTASNECGSVTVSCSAGTVQVTGCTRTQEFTFTATACGLTSTCTRTYTWTVVTAPVFSSNCNITINLGCNPDSLPACNLIGSPRFGAPLTASNECGPVTVNCSAGTVQVNGCARTQEFTFTATACGLTNTCTRTFNWSVNATPPVFTFCPPGSNLGCNPTGVPAPGAATATDGCGGTPTMTSSLGDISSNGCQRSQIRTYKATDACGSTATCTQVFTWTVDNTKPQIVDIPNYTLSGCNAAWPTLTTTWTDNCAGSGTVTATAGTVQSSGCSQSRVYTFTKTDGCGNTAVETTTVTRSYDITRPIFTSIPANVTVQCNNVPQPGTPVAFDNCGTPGITYNGETRTNGACPDSYTLTRRWTAMDACGNTRTATQRITVVDNTKPTFTFVPQNTTLECSGCCGPEVPVGTPIAIDNCDASVTIDYLGEVCIYFECPANRQLRRTWRATDNCGNSTTAVQTIDYRDTQAPTFTFVPQSITIECSDLFPVTPGTPTATDGCDPTVQITFNGQTSAPGDCPQEYVVTRQWTAVDDCGNSVTASQTITVWDTEAPEFNNAPADITVMCGMVPPVPVVTASDNCDNNAPVIYEGEVNNGPNCPYTITRTWSAEDDCENETQHVQVITVAPQSIGNPTPEERFAGNSPGILSAFLTPNPAMDEVWISFDVEKEGETILRLFDINGQLVQQQMFTAAAGPNRYQLDLSGVAKGGMYTVYLLVGDQRAIERLVVLKN